MRFRLAFAMVAILGMASMTAPLGAHGHRHGRSHHGRGDGSGHGGPGAGSATCEAARCTVAAAVAESCPCDVASNHGGYVRCVAHAVKRLANDGTLPRHCRGRVVRCAARSMCGKSDAIVCLIPTDTCNLATGTCVGDPTVVCTADVDCGTQCGVASADRCGTIGGIVSTAPSCCALCGSPSGAFIDD